jgi:hypothetical protein
MNTPEARDCSMSVALGMRSLAGPRQNQGRRDDVYKTD